MPSDVANSPGKSHTTTDGVLRVFMALIGAVMAVGPASAVIAMGGWTFGLLPFCGPWGLACYAECFF